MSYGLNTMISKKERKELKYGLLLIETKINLPIIKQIETNDMTSHIPTYIIFCVRNFGTLKFPSLTNEIFDNTNLYQLYAIAMTMPTTSSSQHCRRHSHPSRNIGTKIT